jgi:hypothetical protein
MEKFSQVLEKEDWFQRITSRLTSESSDYSFSKPKIKMEHLASLLCILRADELTPKYFEHSDIYIPIMRELYKRGIHIDEPDPETINFSLKDYGSAIYPELTHNELVEALNISVPCIRAKSFFMLGNKIKDIHNVLHFPRIYYDILRACKTVNFSRDIQWKVTRPGEQMTNTFHKTILDDPITWYKGNFYRKFSGPNLLSSKLVDIHYLSREDDLGNTVYPLLSAVYHKSKLYVSDGEKLLLVNKGLVINNELLNLVEIGWWRNLLGKIEIEIDLSYPDIVLVMNDNKELARAFGEKFCIDIVDFYFRYGTRLVVKNGILAGVIH